MDPTQLQQLGLTEDQIAQLMQLGVLESEGGTINQELEMATQLRNAPGPQGRFAGRSYNKAHPLEHIAGAINQVRGGIEQKQATERQRENAKRQADLRQMYLSAFLKNRQNPPGATITPGQIPPGGMAPPQRTPAQMFPMPAGGGQAPYGATMTPGMLRR